MGARSLINIAAASCLLFALPGFAQLPAVPQIQLPADIEAPALDQAALPIPDDLQVPSLEQPRLNLPEGLALPNLEQAQAPSPTPAPADTSAPALVQVEAPTTPQLPPVNPDPAPLAAPVQAQVAAPEVAPQVPAQIPEQSPPLAQPEATAQSIAPNLAPAAPPLPVPTLAQSPFTAATLDPAAPPADLCLMTTLAAETYPRAIVRDIQERLHRIYSRDPEWPATEEQGAVRLTDGMLGPVTRSWMGRFCRDFQLQRRGDVITVLPLRVVGIAVFADRYQGTFAARLAERGFDEPVSVLIDPDFAAWVDQLRTAERLQARETLSGGPDADLLALINRYLGVPTQTARAEEPYTFYVLREDDLAELKIGNDLVPPAITAMLRPMLDLEFPERDLLHHAAQNHLINNLGLCEADLAGAQDTRPALLAQDQYRALAPWLSRAFPLMSTLRADGELPSVSCSRFPYEDFAVAYAAAGLREAIENAATERMPAYTHTPILWSGENCGCMPEELASTAYGIYPYWLANGTLQHYDFSIFSRVGYFGLEMSDSGQLRQIRAENAGQTLLNDTSRDAYDFIKVARTYGSKVDWMVDRDWSRNAATDNAALSVRLQLENLRSDIVQLLNRRPTDPLDRLRPLLSLGLSAQPFNGDGVTLYFRNFPTDSESRLEFEYFFHSLKDDLRRLSDERNRMHQIDHDLYVNLVVDQDDFLDPDSPLSSANLEKLLKLETIIRENLSVLETQQRMGSVVILLLNEPYYAALDTIYTYTHETSRSVILPLLITDYRDMRDTPPLGGAVVDSRTKKLDYLHESFGGAAFWPMPQLSEDGAGRYEGFENYITRQFAPGATNSWWTEAICPWRWPLIGIVNAWLILAFTLIAVAFFLYPMNCRRMPWLLNAATRPVSLAIILVPPTIAWLYLLIEDPLLTPFWYPYAATLLLLIIAVLIGRAIYTFMVELRRRKPARVAGYAPRRLAPAGRRTPAQQAASAQTPDDDEDVMESFSAD